jgi:peptide chain release factor 2
MQDLQIQIGQVISDFEKLKAFFNLDGKKNQLSNVTKQVADGDYSVQVLKEKALLEKAITLFGEIETKVYGYFEVLEIADDEIISEIKVELPKIQKQMKFMEMSEMFSGESDKLGVVLEINSGAGGTESQDWSQMIERMYLRWADAKGFKVDTVHRINGEEAGIKQVIMTIEGDNAYGMLKHETGVHRLVRVSPFNAQNKRQTSFCSVLVMPLIDDTIKIEINPADLKIDTFRSSGAGGQHVNTTDSAVRITHMPTGVVAGCQNQRSQLQNRETAMKMLQSKLYEIEDRKRRQKKDSIEKDDISWGNQIRNYVLHPYKLIKDTRTGYEETNPQTVLDGEIDEFIMQMILFARKEVED